MNGKFMEAKFRGICAENGNMFPRGTKIFYEYGTGKAYHYDSKRFKAEAQSIDPAAGYISAQENAYFDNFCLQNNI